MSQAERFGSSSYVSVLILEVLLSNFGRHVHFVEDFLIFVGPFRRSCISVRSRLFHIISLSLSFRLPQAIFEPNLFPYKYPNILNPSYSSYLPAYEDGTDRVFRNVAYKIQTPGNYPEESIQRSEHGESLKSRICLSECFWRIRDI